MEEYPYLIKKTEKNGKEITVLGVKHTKRFLSEHLCFFKKQILKADALVLEHPAGEEFYEDEDDFFGLIGEKARRENKTVYVADPINRPLGFLFLFQYYVLPIATITAISLGKLSPIEILSLTPFLPDTATTYYLDSKIQGKEPFKEDKKYAFTDAIKYGTTDYRDIVIAEGIEKIALESEGEKILAIHGVGHTRGIYHYLKHPNIRRVKRALYKPLSLIADESVRKYVPLPEGGWEKTTIQL